MINIKIFNWFITRRCNLSCDYCRITKNYKYMPLSYPSIEEYYKNEMALDYIINCLEKIKNLFPNSFHIFYGGEPFIRDDIIEIISFCNKNNINYTIITNNSNGVQKNIESVLKKEYILSLTIFSDIQGKKSEEGLKNVLKNRKRIKEISAEIVVRKENINFLEEIIELNTKHEILSDITFLDVSKTRFYDFSDVVENSSLIFPSREVFLLLDKIFKRNDLMILYKNPVFLENLKKILPSRMDCNINDLFNISIDSDGKIRLCNRIRGVFSPKISILNLLKDQNFNVLLDNSKSDKDLLCKKCNWTCMIMSETQKIENIIVKGE